MIYNVNVLDGLDANFKRYIRDVNRDSFHSRNSVDFIWFIHRGNGNFDLLMPTSLYGRNKAGGALGAFNHRHGKGSATLN